MDRYTASPPEGQAFSSGTCSWARDAVYYSKRLQNRSFSNQRERASGETADAGDWSCLDGQFFF